MGKGKDEEKSKEGRRGKSCSVFNTDQNFDFGFVYLCFDFTSNQLFPLRAYARVVLRGLPASETSHHLYFRREEISQDAEVRILVCARKHFFLHLD